MVLLACVFLQNRGIQLRVGLLNENVTVVHGFSPIMKFLQAL
jgi:hypothetical protein